MNQTGRDELDEQLKQLALIAAAQACRGGS